MRRDFAIFEGRIDVRFEKSKIMKIWALSGQETAAKLLCRECTSLRVGANSAGYDDKGADRKDIVIEEVRNENVKYSENCERRIE
jgi:hypothetical protein